MQSIEQYVVKYLIRWLVWDKEMFVITVLPLARISPGSTCRNNNDESGHNDEDEDADERGFTTRSALEAEDDDADEEEDERGFTIIII